MLRFHDDLDASAAEYRASGGRRGAASAGSGQFHAQGALRNPRGAPGLFLALAQEFCHWITLPMETLSPALIYAAF